MTASATASASAIPAAGPDAVVRTLTDVADDPDSLAALDAATTATTPG